MSPSDPFASSNDDDRTILRPSPGGRRRQPPNRPKAQTERLASLGTDFQAGFAGGGNPVIAPAFALLSIVPKLQTLPHHHAVDALQDQLAEEIRRFEKRSLGQGATAEQVKTASYFLCTMIDETVLNTPWGTQSNWGQESLLIQFHREAKGGERFFQILDGLRRHAGQNLSLIELAYLCLSMGFEGKYRLLDRGVRELDQLRQELYLTIQRAREDTEPPLSPHWRGLNEKGTPIVSHFPIWVAVVLAGALVMAIYMGFAYAINKSSNQVYRLLAETAREAIQPRPGPPVKTATPPAVAAVVPRQENRLESLLTAEIAQNLVEVVDGSTIRVSNAFPSGSDQIKKRYVPILAKIARELQNDTRLISVIGHTDNRPIFSARFPSNWHLSRARAKHVADLLQTSATLDGRIRFEGRADTEPIAPNDTVENRARNRRIDIQLR